jgi:8-oxo-dGTP pyrophosphatase MutT (NUDIX family)
MTLRPPVVAAIIVHNGRVLLVRRRVSEGTLSWQFPAGECEPGEEYLATAAREVTEEVGLTVTPTVLIGGARPSRHWSPHDLRRVHWTGLHGRIPHGLCR